MSRVLLKFIDQSLNQDMTFLNIFRKVFSGDLKNVVAPGGFTLKVHSPEIDGELVVDGEVFVE